ncbi:MAG: glycosyltransferase [Saprospiraceae bacterium]|nr:glycosyltransferase [Saprospiraceae bacterium]
MEKGKIKYDVILVFKGMELLPESVLELRTYCRLLVNYNPDHPTKIYSRGSGNKFVKDAISHYHIYSSYAKRICRDLKDIHGVESYFLPFGYDETITIQSNPRLDYLEHFFVFIGAFDRDRERALDQLQSEYLKIFGGSEWESKSKRERIKKSYTGESLYNESYYFAQGKALGSINFLRQQNLIEESHNMRTFEVPFAGGMLIADRTEEQLEFFEEGKEAVYFSTMEELKSLLDFYQKHPEKARAIGLNAHKRSINSNYSYRNRIQEFSKHLLEQL